jgi:NAD kinase
MLGVDVQPQERLALLLDRQDGFYTKFSKKQANHMQIQSVDRHVTIMHYMMLQRRC